jgi:heparin/heparan-sulfate lyase
MSLLALAIALMLAVPGPARGQDVNIPTVPPGHPRVYVRPDDLPKIREKVASEEFEDAWERVKRGAEGSDSYAILCSAFVYLATEDRAVGRRAIEMALPVLKKSDDARVFRAPMHQCACVYDWCYGLLTDDEKQQFIREFERIAASHSPGYPAEPRGGAVVGHSTEGWLLTDQLPAGLAIYDESRKMYDAAARVFFGKFVEVRDFYYPAHAHHQGDSYRARFVYDQAASWLFRRIGAGDVLSREQQFVPYHMLYCLRPDGQQIRIGDTYDHRGKSGRKQLQVTLTGSYYDDPYLLGMVDRGIFCGSSGPSSGDRAFELLFREPGVATRPLDELPKTKYFAEPMGEMVARTGWQMGAESRDAIAHMRIGEYFFGNHQRKDFGTFQLYYRGALAISSGIYQGDFGAYGSEHWLHYYHQTISHNGLLIFDPAEKQHKGAVNDGGQRFPNEGRDHPRDLEELLSNDYRMAEVTAHEFGPDAITPEYSYIAGDITKAYTSKVSKVTRSMVTLNTGDATYPCVLVVFDRVASADPSFKKTWLLHTIQEPMIERRTVSVVRDEGDYGGKLVAESLLPEEASITKVGGPGWEFWVESAGTNYRQRLERPGVEAGAWRIKVSPAAPARADEFLHVLTVMDEDTARGPAVRAISSDDLVGAAVLDRIALFGRSGELLDGARFTVEGDGRLKFLVCDLQPGRWSVARSGQPVGEALPVSADGKCVYFEGASGSYELRGSSKRRGRDE